MEVLGKGNVKLVLKDAVYIISDVYFVPKLKNNLLSLGQLQEKNVTIIIKEGTCKMYHEERGLIAESNMSQNRMFILFDEADDKSRLEHQRCLQIASEEMPKIWHERYEHLSHQGMKTLQTKDIVRGLPVFDTQNYTCTNCLIGKQPRNSIPKRSS